ncbi:MAG TPA: hypothetical protein V6C99_03415 [Oculatellaceae cyanobacterium]
MTDISPIYVTASRRFSKDKPPVIRPAVFVKGGAALPKSFRDSFKSVRNADAARENGIVLSKKTGFFHPIRTLRAAIQLHRIVKKTAYQVTKPTAEQPKHARKVWNQLQTLLGTEQAPITRKQARALRKAAASDLLNVDDEVKAKLGGLFKRPTLTLAEAVALAKAVQKPAEDASSKQKRTYEKLVQAFEINKADVEPKGNAQADNKAVPANGSGAKGPDKADAEGAEPPKAAADQDAILTQAQQQQLADAKANIRDVLGNKSKIVTEDETLKDILERFLTVQPHELQGALLSAVKALETTLEKGENPLVVVQSDGVATIQVTNARQRLIVNKLLELKNQLKALSGELQGGN